MAVRSNASRWAFGVAALAVLLLWAAPQAAQAVLISQYGHENAGNRLQDDVDSNPLTNQGGVVFLTPPEARFSILGASAGWYPRAGTGYLNVPDAVYAGGDFTFVCLALKTGSDLYHETLLGSTGYRFQYQPTSPAPGNLRLDVKSDGNASPTDTFPTDAWQFVAMTYRASDKLVQGYIAPSSGSISAPVFSFNVSNTSVETANTFKLGRDWSGIGGADEFLGYIDHSRFYSDYKTSAQLQTIFQEYGPLAAKPKALLSKYDHEQANPLLDDVDARPLANAGGVTFSAPASPGSARLGNTAGTYPRTGSGYLDAPSGVYEAGEDFTFTAFVRKTGNYTGSHETILASNLFRLQYREDGGGRLYLQTKDTTSQQTAAGAFAADQWYFIALRYDALSRLLEGFLQPASSTLTGPQLSFTVPLTTDLGAMTSFRIGMDGVSGIGGGDSFLGQIDAERFYRGFLSNAELQDVLAIYIPEPGTLALLGLGLAALARRRARGV